MSTAAPAPSVLAVFRRRDFSLLWLAQLVSTAGSSLTDLAAAIWVYDQTGSALAVGLTLMATAVPSLVVGLLAGVYVDRHDRKRIMMMTCLVQAVIVAIIAAAVQLDSVIGLYALLLLNAGVKQFFDPAHDSIIPEMANDEELTAANAFLSIASFGSTAIGFAGAGLLASTVGVTAAFVIDAVTFVVAAGLISLMGRYEMPIPEEEASVAVIVANLKSGITTLFETPIIRSLFIVGAFMFVAFGLWNVLLLPFSIEVLGATEFEYGIQEGLTSVGFVVGSLLMARFSRLLPEPVWIVVSLVGMGLAGLGYAMSTEIGPAILLVTLSGLLQPPSSVSRSVLLQRNTPREMRGRVFSAFYVMRDVIFLIGMAGAGLADIVDIRLLVVVASSLLFVSAGFTLVAPGLGITHLACGVGEARRGCRDRDGPRHAAGPGRHPGRLRPARLAPRDLRPAVARAARRVRGRRHRPRGPDRHADRPARGRRIVRLLRPRRVGHGRHPGGRRRLPRPVDDGRGRLLRRDRGTDRQPAHGGRRRGRGLDAARSPVRARSGRPWWCRRSSACSCPR